MTIQRVLVLGPAICAIGVPVFAQPAYNPPATAPAEAMTYMYGRDFWNGAPEDIHQRLDWLSTRFSRAEREGLITWAEARRVSRSLHQASAIEARLSRRDSGHLSRQDHDYMMLRLNNVSSQIHWAKTNRLDLKQVNRY